MSLLVAEGAAPIGLQFTMRWFVEISPLGKGKGPSTKLCVEASHWQPALQKARALRGDDAALSNFSIELLDDGYRAIDPAARLRYIVKKAPDDAALTSEVAAKPVSIPPPPPSKKRPTMMPITIPPPAVEGALSPRDAEPRRKSGSLAIPSDKVPPPPQQGSVPPFKQVSSREEEPSSRSPLTYREAAYTVAPGTSPERAEDLIRDRFKEVQGMLATRKAGKLVNLAVFDHAFQGKPQRPPLVTLTWKDWKGSQPEVRFPLRDGPGNTPTPLAPMIARTPPAPPAAPPTTPAPEKASVDVAASSPRPVAPAPAPAPAPLVPAKVEAIAVAPKIEAPPPAPVKVEAVPAKPAAAELEAPRAAKAAPVQGAAATNQAWMPAQPSEEIDIVDTSEAVDFEPKPARVPSAPTSQRLVGDDLLAELFEACCDLQFLKSPLDGADFVLALTLEKLPAEVGLVSLFDLNKREFVVVRQAGGTNTAVLARLPERAPLAHTAMRSRHTVVIADAAADRRVLDDERWKAAGITPSSVVCAPVELNGRYLGLIELANPLDGHHFSAGDGHALTYIGQQYAEFVASHGFVIDPEVVTEGPKKGRLR